MQTPAQPASASLLKPAKPVFEAAVALNPAQAKTSAETKNTTPAQAPLVSADSPTPAQPVPVRALAPPRATVVIAHKPLEGNTLTEEFADLQNRIRRIEKEAQANNDRMKTIQDDIVSLQN